jgi:hypothetical protein
VLGTFAIVLKPMPSKTLRRARAHPRQAS